MSSSNDPRRVTPDAPPRPPSSHGRAGETVPAYVPGQVDMPEQFGRYRIQRKLGGGGMGAVYLAEDTTLGRLVALKVPYFMDGDPEVGERFLQEARSAAKLDHPNLCQIFDVGVLDGIYFLTMRLLKGQELDKFAGTPQPYRKVAEVVFKLAQAMESAHARKIIHRDLKPANVMMVAGTGPTVFDFGLAKQTQKADIRLTQAGTVMGTPAYMPPEQLQGRLDLIGPASDVYSLGVIFYEFLTGRLPFEAPSIPELFARILGSEPPVAPSRLRPELPPELDAICLAAMHKVPAQRHGGSMKQFAAALAAFLKSSPPDRGAGSLVPNPAAASPKMPTPSNRAGMLGAATLPPLPSPSGGHAALLNAATMAPGRDSGRSNVLGAQTLPPPLNAGSGAQSFDFGASVAPAHPSPARAGAKAKPKGEKGGGVPWGTVCTWGGLVLMMGAALSGMGWLAYTLNNRNPKPEPVAAGNDKEGKKTVPQGGNPPVGPGVAPGGPVGAPGGPVGAPGGPVGAPGGPVGAPGGPGVAPGGPGVAPGMPGLGSGETAPASPAFAAATVWKGTWRPTQSGTGGTIVLTVESRTGNEFRGEMRVTGASPPLSRMTGSVNGDRIVWKTEAPAGRPSDERTFTATLKGNSLAGRWGSILKADIGTFVCTLTGETPPDAPPDAPRPTPPKEKDPNALVEENFSDIDVGDRPKGWEGDDLSVQQKDGKRFLAVTNAKAEMFFVTLPKIPLRGDFVLECDLVVVGRGFGGRGIGEFRVELSGKGGTPLTLVANYAGLVKLGSNAEQLTEGFRPLTPMQFRLTRKKDLYQVSINQLSMSSPSVSGATIKGKGAFDEVKLGLTGGVLLGNGSRIFRVNITSLEAKGDLVATAPPGKDKDPDPKEPSAKGEGFVEALRKGEDFRKVEAGNLPKGWKGDETVVCVQHNGGDAALSLIKNAPNKVSLPPVKLDGGFWLEAGVTLSNPSSSLSIRLDDAKGGGGTKVWIFGTGYVVIEKVDKLDGRIQQPYAPPRKQGWKAGGARNEVRIERTKEAFVVKLNDIEVGTVPFDSPAAKSMAGGKYAGVSILMTYGARNGLQAPQSPKVHSIRLAATKADE